jgi:hypothetical protein
VVARQRRIGGERDHCGARGGDDFDEIRTHLACIS